MSGRLCAVTSATGADQSTVAIALKLSDHPADIYQSTACQQLAMEMGCGDIVAAVRCASRLLAVKALFPR
jgi:hypothetical protein